VEAVEVIDIDDMLQDCSSLAVLLIVIRNNFLFLTPEERGCVGKQAHLKDLHYSFGISFIHNKQNCLMKIFGIVVFNHYGIFKMLHYVKTRDELTYNER
jgi:hypothetical protein